jgi:hypothetical protein
MAPYSKFVSEPSFFSDPDGICGLEMEKLVGFSFGGGDTKIIPLVVYSRFPPVPPRSNSSLAITSPNLSRNITVLHPYYFPIIRHRHLNSKVKTEMNNRNPSAKVAIEFTTEHLQQPLRSSPASSLLLIMSHWSTEAQTFSDPVLHIVACPVMASTLGSFGSTNCLGGLNLHTAWDPSISHLSDLP